MWGHVGDTARHLTTPPVKVHSIEEGKKLTGADASSRMSISRLRPRHGSDRNEAVDTTKQPERRRTTFGFLHLFAATAVLIVHATNLTNEKFLWHGPDSADTFWFYDGVAIFFILSGYFVYRTAENGYRRHSPWIDYARNRFVRIAPPLYAYFFLICPILLLIGAITWDSMAEDWRGLFVWIATSLAFIPGYDAHVFDDFGSGILNGSLWTMSVQVSFYVLVPILVIAAQRFGFGKIIGLSALVAILAPLVAHTVGGVIEKLIHMTFLEYFAFFVVGVFCGRYWNSIPQRQIYFVASLLVYVAVTAFVPREFQALTDPLLIAIPLGYCVLYFGHHAPSWLEEIPRRLGDISFGVYIWHWPIINAFIWFGWVSVLQNWTVPLILVVSFAVAWASWHLVEKPALRFKARAKAVSL